MASESIANSASWSKIFSSDFSNTWKPSSAEFSSFEHCSTTSTTPALAKQSQLIKGFNKSRTDGSYETILSIFYRCVS